MLLFVFFFVVVFFVFFQAEDGIRDLVRSRGLGDVYKRQGKNCRIFPGAVIGAIPQDLKYRGEYATVEIGDNVTIREYCTLNKGTAASDRTIIGNNSLLICLLYTSDAADERSSVDLGGRRIIKTKKIKKKTKKKKNKKKTKKNRSDSPHKLTRHYLQQHERRKHTRR